MDDVTIEDDIQFNQQFSKEKSIERNWSHLFNEQWISLFIVSMILLIFVCFYQRRKSPSRKNQLNEDQLIDRHEQIEIIRQKQQKLYEEQINQFEQRKKQRIENAQKSEEKSAKYRTSDHNPLTGQSNSCSWRPAKKNAAGG